MLVEINRPILTFSMLQPNLMGGVLATRALRGFFGGENYDLFRLAGKQKEYVPEEDRQRVDREVYAKVAKLGGVAEDQGERLWKQALELSNRTVNYARLKLFADQERQATLTTNIAWSSRRPSSVLEILTTPVKYIGEQCKYEQGRQLALGLLCAEIISGDENGHSGRILEEINRVLEDQFFIDSRRGDPKGYHIFSYHTPGTNRLAGVSSQYPDSQFAEGLWVKSLSYPVRTIGLRNADGVQSSVKALYDPREKETESGVIKTLQRSLITVANPSGIVETSPYVSDRLGFMTVVMGGRPLRDMVTANLEDLFAVFGDGIDQVLDRDQVRSENGLPDRVEFRRREFHIRGLNIPLEVIIQSLEDYISSQYEIGEFDSVLGMHNGQAHDLYKLKIVADVAEYLWPFKIFGIDLADTKKAASYEYATRLGRKQRIHPSLYAESVA